MRQTGREATNVPEWETSVLRVRTHCRLSRCLAEVAILKWQNLTDKEIAAQLRIPVATARGRLRRLYHDHGLPGPIPLALAVERALSRAECAAVEDSAGRIPVGGLE
jgi:hypothetical protein